MTDWLTDPVVNRILARWPYAFDDKRIVSLSSVADDYQAMYANGGTRIIFKEFLGDTLTMHFRRVALDEWEGVAVPRRHKGKWGWTIGYWDNVRGWVPDELTYDTEIAAIIALFTEKLREDEPEMAEKPEPSIDERHDDTGRAKYLLSNGFAEIVATQGLLIREVAALTVEVAKIKESNA